MMLTNKWHNGTDPLRFPDPWPTPWACSLSSTIYPKRNSNRFSATSIRDLSWCDIRSSVFSPPIEISWRGFPQCPLLPVARWAPNRERAAPGSQQQFVGTRRWRQLWGVHSISGHPGAESSQSVGLQRALGGYSQAVQSLCNEVQRSGWVARSYYRDAIIDYHTTFPGKYDTLLDDSALALYLAGADNLTFPTGHKPSSTRANLRNYFDPLPIGAIRKLYDIYEDDFRLFDYALDEVLGFEFG